MSTPWVYLLLAGACEIVWAVSLKHTEGFKRPLPTALTIGALALSMYLLGRAVKTLPMGTAYAVWTGIGAVGVAAVGILFYDEPRNPMRIASMAMIVLGIIGLNAASK